MSFTFPQALPEGHPVHYVKVSHRCSAAASSPRQFNSIQYAALAAIGEDAGGVFSHPREAR